MTGHRHRIVFAIIGTLVAGSALAQSLSDSAREKRWAEQIVPGIVVGDAVDLQTEDGSRFLGLLTVVERARGAVLLIHGAGMHPDHGIVGELRVHLADRGYTTLSLQMPVTRTEDESLREYLKLFPEAERRIAAGVRFLQDKGAGRVAIVSHTGLGTGMAYRYLRRRLHEAPIFAWVALSFFGRMEGMAGAPFPIFDLYGTNDFREMRGNADQRKGVLDTVPGSRQLAAPDGGRNLAGGEKTVLREVPAFLDATAK